jgi:hypothetical protein
MKGYPLVPGVLDPGHDAADSTWHPGTKADCPQCQPPSPAAPTPVVEVKVEVEIHIPGVHKGSDCMTGKRQYATRKDALAAATSLRYGYGHRTVHPFRCSWCMCWHTGNADRSNNSKSRKRR